MSRPSRPFLPQRSARGSLGALGPGALLAHGRALAFPVGGQRSPTAVTVAVGALLLWLFQWGLYRNGPMLAAAVVFVASALIGTMAFLEVGIAVVILSMSMSPEIGLGALASRSLTLRLEDIMIPIVALAWIGRKALGIEERSLRTDRIIPYMALFLAVQLYSSYMAWGRGSVDGTTSLLYILKQAEYFAIFYFTFQYVNSTKRSRILLGFAVLTALVIALYNVKNIPGTAVWTRHRITAPFEGTPEPSSIGGYFVLVMALLLAMALEAPTTKIRLSLLAVAAIVFVPFLYTLSRTSYVAFLIMVVLLALHRKSRAILVALATGLVLSPVLLPRAVIERVLYTFNDPIKVLGHFDRSFGERIFIWRKVYWTLLGDPFLGRGVTYQMVLDSYYARVLIETGVVGLVCFVLVIARLFRLAARVRSGHPQWWARAFALGYIAGLGALLVHAFSAITFVIVRIMEPFWLVSGIVAALAYQVREAAPEPAVALESSLRPARLPGPLGRQTWTRSSGASAS